jgi:hypothetical protein
METGRSSHRSKLLLLTVLLWLTTFLFIGIHYLYIVERFSGMAFLMSAGVMVLLLCASIASSAYLKERNQSVRTIDLESSSALAQRVKNFATTRWLAWDCAFGIVIPLVFLVIDPFVFKNPPGTRTMLPEYRPGAYALIIQSTLVLAVWISVKPHRFSLWLSGALFSGAAGAFAIGLALLPLSALCLMFFGAGLLGFVPFVTAATFLRRATQAWRLGRREASQSGALCHAAAGAILAVVPAAIFHFGLIGRPSP